MTGALVAWRTPDYRLELLLMHLGIAALGTILAGTRGGETPRVLFFSGLLALLTADLFLTQDPLAITVLCMTFVVVAAPFLVLRVKLATAVSCSTVSAALALLLLDGTGARLALAVSIPVVCYSIAAYGISTFLRRFADTTDRADAAATAEHEKLILARASARTTAELSRTLHDTVVNTLAAIAAGGRAVADPDCVRLRCAQDVASISSLYTSGKAANDGIDDVGSGLSISITWTGVDSSMRRDWISRLSSERRTALRGVIKELLLNVEKHAGTDEVVIDLQATAGALVVAVVDDGIGFATRSDGRGLTESVYRRASDAGVDVRVCSTPGQGTRATVICPLTDPSGGELWDGPSLDGSADSIRRAGTWVWCVGVCAASLISGAVGTATTGTFISSGLVVSLSLIAWSICKHGNTLPIWLEVLVIAAVPIAFAFGFVGANFDGGDPAFWQAIGLTPLLVILLNTSRSWPPVVIAALALSAAAAASAWSVWNISTDAAGTAIAHACIALAQLGVWVIFVKILSDLTTRSNAARQRAIQDVADRAAVVGASRIQERWRDAQLQRALDLLRDIAGGRCSATDPDVQRRAGREEHSLRQLLLLSPDLTHLGPWLARCIGQSRTNDIQLTIRGGDVDLPDDRTARAIGGALTYLLDVTKPGTELVLGYFSRKAAPFVTVVGPSGFCARLKSDLGDRCEIRMTALPLQDLIEIGAPPAHELLPGWTG